ncbi:hypothetical protein PAXINDRAFT_17437 [Paxillus involutus ATCC 200175]|uniref:Uncharacterized protein n=1 Tax=Paxillus involutus ATCC 200175 TaxID=664439 RepID=A0A0C9T169_PAXIN|nr:hypothetical protein PAXINDRAFT_17437 [Paxillus involutus ATCC 200175]
MPRQPLRLWAEETEKRGDAQQSGHGGKDNKVQAFMCSADNKATDTLNPNAKSTRSTVPVGKSNGQGEGEEKRNEMDDADNKSSWLKAFDPLIKEEDLTWGQITM